MDISSSVLPAAARPVVPGRNGWIVPAQDPGALVARLLACARGRGVLVAMQPRCRESAAAPLWESGHPPGAVWVASVLATPKGEAG